MWRSNYNLEVECSEKYPKFLLNIAQVVSKSLSSTPDEYIIIAWH